MFYSAIKDMKYTCYLSEGTMLPMMYMPDAIRATIQFMDNPSGELTTRMAYNLAGMSFTPADLAAEIKNLLPEFSITYQPDHRQVIANSWPESIDDIEAKTDWGWQPNYDLQDMTADMLSNLTRRNAFQNSVRETRTVDHKVNL
jgi:nucleoside-diphosphate-sugar epimerase